MAKVNSISSHKGYLKNIRRTASTVNKQRLDQWVEWFRVNDGDAAIQTELRLMGILSGGIGT